VGRGRDRNPKLILKGGGCENMNIQYSVPCDLAHLGRADRNLEGVRKCILHAVWQAQGQGCAPGALGVCIGSDRAHGYELAKGQLFRTLDDTNPNPCWPSSKPRSWKRPTSWAWAPWDSAARLR
jgi:fumarate hydratase class I